MDNFDIKAVVLSSTLQLLYIATHLDIPNSQMYM